MSAKILPRELGCRITCNNCQATTATASTNITGNRAFATSLGWGRGSDPGKPYRDGREARPTVRGDDGKIFAAIYRWLGPWAVLALVAYGILDTAVCAWLVLWRRA